MFKVKEIMPRLWLQQLRKESGMTTDALARKVGITPQALWLIESGQRMPGLLVGVALADALKFDVRKFLEEEKAAS